MSADNWAPCPKAENNPAHDDDRVSNDDDRVSNPMREDWELGILDGEFYVYYRASCRACGFKFEHRVEQPV